MRGYFFLTITFVFFLSFSFAQVSKRHDNEAAEAFVNRIKPPDSELTHKVLETKWNSNNVIIALYRQTYKLPVKSDPDQSEYLRIIATIFIKVEGNNYHKYIIDTIDTEGGEPVIESVFFANTDTDAAKELILIASWVQRHYDVGGKLYSTLVYDDLLTSPKLKFKKGISEKLSGGCDCSWRDGTTKKAKFKTAPEVRAELLRMGFK